MCYITATELKNNLSYYLKLSETEDVHVTKNKRVIAVISNPKAIAIQNFISLRGCLKPYDDGKPYKEIIGEEIAKKCGY